MNLKKETDKGGEEFGGGRGNKTTALEVTHREIKKNKLKKKNTSKEKKIIFVAGVYLYLHMHNIFHSRFQASPQRHFRLHGIFWSDGGTNFLRGASFRKRGKYKYKQANMHGSILF